LINCESVCGRTFFSCLEVSDSAKDGEVGS
jgi:hypothetical protein